MKNLKSFLSYKNLDFAAIQILLSIIAISLAGIVGAASPTLGKLEFSNPILPTAGDEIKICPIPYANDSWKQQTQRTNFCETQGTGILKMDLAPLQNLNKIPLCSWHDQRVHQQIDGVRWQQS